jgi:uracil-DNA glycosylase
MSSIEDILELDLPTVADLPSQPRDLWYGTTGPRTARIFIVGEAWGRTEEEDEKPFVGEAGKELDRMLAEAGIDRNECFVTNVAAKRPSRNEMFTLFEAEPKKGETAENPKIHGLRVTPFIREEIERLYRQIEAVKPAVIVACGSWALWALSDKAEIGGLSPYGKGGPRYAVPSGIMDHRGSMHYAIRDRFEDVPTLSTIPLLPVIHPAAVLRQWDLRPVTVHDLKRIPRAFTGDWRPRAAPIILAPATYQEAMSRFDFILRKAEHETVRLACDIETARRRIITCIGFADSANFAMVVPFVRLTADRAFESYWTPEQEFNLVRKMQDVFRHPNVLIEGQNFIYDTQYIQAWFGVTPRLSLDTMLAHHLIFPGTPKSLAHLSSLYCEYHWFWKDDSKDWDTTGTLEQHLLYNGMDCLRTFEAGTVLRQLLVDMGVEHLWKERLRRNEMCLKMMNRGILVDRKVRAKMSMDIAMMIGKLQERLENIIPCDVVDEVVAQVKSKKPSATPWYRSPDKQKIFFQEVLGMRLPRSRKTGEDTLGKEGLEDLRVQYPHYKKMFDLLSDIRSLGVFQSNFCAAPLESTGRMMCSFNPAGTETFRLSSSENAFGRGTNLQNLPVGDDK